MSTYLVVANQTLGGEQLRKELGTRLNAEDDVEFYVVVPQTQPKDYARNWSLQADPAFGMPDAASDEEARDKARRNAETRLRRLVEDIRSEGGQADGTLGAEDPLTAIEQVIEVRDFDEIILSTLPAGVSRWLGMDLPSRVERKFDLPVTTVIAEG